MSKLSPQEALIHVMVATSAADRSMTDAEIARIGQMVSNLPVFADFDENALVATAQSCAQMLSESVGLDETLETISRAIPAKLHETAYALAVEVAAADLRVGQEEVRFLALLGEALELDKLTMAAIERGARARHARV